MENAPQKKSSAYYQRQFRERLRSQGLVKKEVWILPDYATALSTIEARLRDESLASELVGYLIDEKDHQVSLKRYWTTERLYQAINNPSMLELLACNAELIAGIEPIIHLQMLDFGDLPVFVSVQGEQIIAETILCVADEINDVAGFHDMVLRTHKYLPLSTISLDSLSLDYSSLDYLSPNDTSLADRDGISGGTSSGISGDDTERFDAYQMFGAVSAQSSLSDIIIEIQMLCQNVMQALEIYESFFKQHQSE